MAVQRGRKKNYAQRQNIINVCYSLFTKTNYDSVTTREIATQCEIERSLLHHYFNKKEHIAGEILKTITGNISDFLLESLQISPGDPYLMAYYYSLFLRTIEKRKGLKSLYLVLLKSTPILIETLDSAIDSEGTILPFSSSQEEELATIITIGAISQLLIHQSIGEIDLDLNEIIDRIVRVHFLYLGFPQESIPTILETVGITIKTETVEKFVKYYETKNNWLA